MTQPIFGQHAFAESPTPNAVDAFDLITGEQLQNIRTCTAPRFPRASSSWTRTCKPLPIGFIQTSTTRPETGRT